MKQRRPHNLAAIRINAELIDLMPPGMESLQSLDLSFNHDIYGTIPTFISQWSSLEWIRLENNQLSGSLPSQLGLLTHLKTLAIGVNQFTGMVPTEIGLLTNLRRLEIQQNNFTGLPSEVLQLTNLATLRLDLELVPTLPSESWDQFTSNIDLFDPYGSANSSSTESGGLNPP